MSDSKQSSRGGTPRAQPLYFGPPDSALFGWYHAPAGTPRDTSVVIPAPFGVEAVFAHRALRHIAEQLAHAGFAVLRYDHAGTGDSQGTSVEPGRVRAWLAGVRVALETVRALSGASRSAIVGLRLGATLGACAAADGGVDALALWAPIVSGKQYARELRAFSRMGGAPSGGGAGGFALEADTLSGLAELELASLRTRPAEHVLIVPRDDLPDDGATAEHLRALGAAVRVAPAPGYAAAVVEPHNTQVPTAVIDAITTWLGEVAGPDIASGVATPITRDSLLTTESSDERGVSVPVRERPVFLDDGRRLMGILSEPDSPSHRETAIVLVNAGAVSRVGPNRLYVHMAREWAARGFRVLRMDIGGIGDSDPALGLAENDTYPTTAVSDVATGIEALRARGDRRFVVAGLCSGAHTSFHLGVDVAPIEGLAGLILMNPIVFYWKPGDALDVGAWETYAAAQWYKRRARSPQAWLRVVTGKVRLQDVITTFVRRASTLVTAAASRLRARVGGRRANDLAHDLLGIVERPVNLLLAFSDGDPGLDQLRLHAGHALRRLGRHANFRLVTFDDADHTFTQIDAQRRLRAALAEHLTTTFG